MGRPPLNVKATVVRLPADIPERIDVLVGKNKRAKFIRDAVIHELERLEREAEASAGDTDSGAVPVDQQKD